MALFILFISSCSDINDELAPCPEPSSIEMHFEYTYNMIGGDAFSRKVHCLSIYIFDEKGIFKREYHIPENAGISENDFSIDISIEPGKYKCVAYGGMECPDASFSHLNSFIEDATSIKEIQVELNEECISHDSEITLRNLHDHFYGSSGFSVPENGKVAVTVPMMCNTNSLHIALQHVSGSIIDVNDFDFEITDDNNTFNAYNELISTGEITYHPWKMENHSILPTSNSIISEEGSINVAREEEENGKDGFYTATASFKVSRIVPSGTAKTSQTRLTVIRKNDGQKILSLPLVDYMLLFKDHINSRDNLTDQEYLDRENNWQFVFFLDDTTDSWINSHIIINDWVVRFNNQKY